MSLSSQAITLIICFIGCLVSFYFQNYLSFDASYQFYSIHKLERFLIINGRESMGFFQLPLFLFHKNDMAYNSYLYGVVYAFIPFTALLLSYINSFFINTRYFIYSVIGIIGVNLFGTYHILSEHLIATMFFWPLIGSIHIYNHSKKSVNLVLIVLLTIFIYFLHPASLILICAATFYLIYTAKNKTLSLWVLSLFMISSILVKTYQVFRPVTEFFTPKTREYLFKLFNPKQILNYSAQQTYMLYIAIFLLFIILPIKKNRWGNISFLIISIALITDGFLNHYNILHIAGLSTRHFYWFFTIILLVLFLNSNSTHSFHKIAPIVFSILFLFYTCISAHKRINSLENITKYMEHNSKQCISVYKDNIFKQKAPPMQHWSLTFELTVKNRNNLVNQCLLFNCQTFLEDKNLKWIGKDIKPYIRCFN